MYKVEGYNQKDGVDSDKINRIVLKKMETIHFIKLALLFIYQIY
jgi:hypothetical protein